MNKKDIKNQYNKKIELIVRYNKFYYNGKWLIYFLRW